MSRGPRSYHQKMSQASIPSPQAVKNPPNSGGSAPNKPVLTLADMVSQAARDLKRVEFAKTMLGLSIIVSLLALALILVDHWVWPLPRLFRMAFLVTTCGASVFWVLRRLIPMLGRTINPIFAARQIETKVPELKDSLVSYMQLNERDNSTPKGVVTAIGRFAVDRLSRHDVSEFVSSSTPLRLAIWLFAILVLSAIYFVVSPKSGFDSLLRLVMPWHSINAPTRVKIVKVSPQDVVIARGQKVEVEVELTGLLKGDPIQIEFSSLDGQFVKRTIEMQEEVSGLMYRGFLTMGENGIVQDLEYLVRAGDVTAGPFSVTLEQMPVVAIERIEFEYPRYTRLAPTQVNSASGFTAIEGTKVRIFGKSNQEMKSGKIEVSEKTAGGEPSDNQNSYSMAAQKEILSGTFQLQLNKNRDNPSPFTYRVSAISSLGQSTQDPVSREFEVTKDEDPEISWSVEYPETLELPVNQVSDFVMSASDPDFGLSQIRTVLVRGRSKLDERTLLQNPDGIQKPVSRTWRFEPAKMGLRPGDELTLEAIASDNRRDIHDSRWEPNHASSRVLKIHIVAEQKKPTEFSKPEEQAKPLPEQPTDGSDVQPPKEDKQDEAKGNDNSAESKGEDGKSDSGETADDKQKAGDAPSEGGNKESSDSNATSDDNESNGQAKGDKSATDEENAAKGENGDSDKSGDKSSSDKQESGDSQKGNPGESEGDSNKQSKDDKSSSDKGGQSSTPDNKTQGQGGNESEQGDPSDQGQGQGQQGESGAGGQSSKGQPGGEQSSQSGNSAGGNGQKGNSKSGQGNPDSKGSKGNSGTGQKSDNSSSAKAESSDEGGEGSEDATTSEDGGDEGGQSSQGNSNSKGGKGSKQKSSNSDQGGSSGGEQTSSESSDSVNQNGSGSEGASSPQNSNSPPKNGNKGRLENVQRGNRNSDAPKHDGEAFEEINEWIKEHGDPKANPGSQNQTSNQDESQENNRIDQASDSNTGNPSQQQPNDQTQGASNSDQQNGSNSKSAQDEQSKNNPSSMANGKDKDGNPAKGSPQQDASQANQQGKNGQPSQSQQSQGDPNSQANAQANNGNSPSQSGNKSDSNSGNQSSSGNSPSGKQASSSDSNEAPAGAGDSPSARGGSETQKGSGHTTAAPSKANVDYAKKVTDLALDYLDRQKDQPDPELLKRLGWTDEELKAFVERWKKARENGITPEGTKQDYANDLRALGIKPPTAGKRNSAGVDDKLSGLSEEGGRSKPPTTLQSQYDAFRKAAQQRAPKK